MLKLLFLFLFFLQIFLLDLLHHITASRMNYGFLRESHVLDLMTYPSSVVVVVVI
jgi:hypothetical protein